MSALRAEIEAQQRALDKERQEISGLKSRLSIVTKERDKLARQIGLIESCDGPIPRKPHWMAPSKKSTHGNRATLCILLTDTHFDEVVDPAEVDGINAYNREIAELRLRRCIERAIMLARQYLGGVKYDGVSLFLGGDIFSGNIHEELARTNADTLFGSLLHWIGPMTAAIGMLGEEFRHVHASCVVGNHGRQTRKPISKQRAADNLDWLFYRLVARELASERGITWDIPTAADAHVQVYGTRYLLTHADQFRGGTGISGALAPLLLGTHRKTRRQAAAGRPYDYLVGGHWHQHIFLPSRGLLLGGALKGYDEHAYLSNWEQEPPQQALWVTTPEHGITFSAPIFVMDRRAEGW